jgi:hypothetical protein
MTIDQFARSGMMGPTTNELRSPVQFEGGSYDPALVSAFQKYRGGASATPQPTQMGLGALAMRQGPQMDPGMMQMMQRLQDNASRQAQRTDGMMPPAGMGPRVDQFGRPSDTGQFAFDPQQQQRIAEAGLTPDRLSQMTPDQMARFQPMAPVDIDPMTGRPIDARRQSQIMAQQAFANQQQGGMMGGMPVQRPMPFDPRRLPVGAGDKGAGMDPRMMNPPRPGLPSTMTNNRRLMMQNQRTQAANPFFAQMMRGGSR